MKMFIVRICTLNFWSRGKQLVLFSRGTRHEVFCYIATETGRKENELTPTSIVSVGFSVATVLLKPPYEIQKVMQHHFCWPFVCLPSLFPL